MRHMEELATPAQGYRDPRAPLLRWRCRAGDDAMRAFPWLMPTEHYVRDPDGRGGAWCSAGYERVDYDPVDEERCPNQCDDDEFDCPDCEGTGLAEPGMFDLGSCPYYRKCKGLPGADAEGVYGPGTCQGGCVDEPACITCEPRGGWPSAATLEGP